MGDVVWWPPDTDELFSLPVGEVLNCLRDDAWRRKKGKKGQHPSAKGHEVMFRVDQSVERR